MWRNSSDCRKRTPAEDDICCAFCELSLMTCSILFKLCTMSDIDDDCAFDAETMLSNNSATFDVVLTIS